MAQAIKTKIIKEEKDYGNEDETNRIWSTS